MVVAADLKVNKVTRLGVIPSSMLVSVERLDYWTVLVRN